LIQPKVLPEFIQKKYVWYKEMRYFPVLKEAARRNLYRFLLFTVWNLPFVYELEEDSVYNRLRPCDNMAIIELSGRLAAIYGILKEVGQLQVDRSARNDRAFSCGSNEYSFKITRTRDGPSFVKWTDVHENITSIYDIIQEELQRDIIRFLSTVNAILKELSIPQIIANIAIVQNSTDWDFELDFRFKQLLRKKSAGLGALHMHICDISSTVQDIPYMLKEVASRNLYRFLLFAMWKLHSVVQVTDYKRVYNLFDQCNNMTILELSGRLSAISELLNERANGLNVDKSKLIDVPFISGGKKYSFKIKRASKGPAFVKFTDAHESIISIYDMIQEELQKDMIRFLSIVNAVLKELSIEQITDMFIVQNSDNNADDEFVELLRTKSAGLGALHMRLCDISRRVQNKDRTAGARRRDAWRRPLP